MHFSTAGTAGAPQFVHFDHQLTGPGAFDLSGQLATGKTQLHQAIADHNLYSLKMLLFSGVAVNVKDHLGNEPLHSAVLTGQDDTVDLLLRFGADPNAKGPLNRSPLHLAVSHSTIVDVLLKNGADSSDQDENGDSPLHLALPTIPTRPVRTPPVVNALVKAGCDVNQPNKAGLTPFLKLLGTPREGEGFYDLVILFLEHGGSVHKPLPDGRTPLQLFLARSGDRWAWALGSDGANRAFRHFLDKGVPIEMATTSSGKPLALGLFKPSLLDFKLAKIFCERADPNEDLGRRDTLLHKVLGSRVWGSGRHCDVEPLVEVLLQRGANASHRNLDGQTPLETLFERPKAESIAGIVTERIVQMLVDKDAEVSQEVIIKAARQFPKSETILRQLLQTYARQLGNRQETSESHSTPAEQQWWDEWVHAARAGEWTGVKRVLSQSHMRSYPKTGPRFAIIALAVLMEMHIWAFKDRVRENPTEKERQREHVAEVLHFCRSQELPVDMACFDYLVELCL